MAKISCFEMDRTGIGNVGGLTDSETRP